MRSASRPEWTSALRTAAERARLSPSIHNTQPWRFVLRPSAIEVHVDRSRQLAVLDPRGRQLMISCGCAVFNARVSLAASLYGSVVQPHPDPSTPDFAARITVAELSPQDQRLARLDSAIDERHTNRFRFADEEVPDDVVDALVAAAATEGARLLPIVRPEHRFVTARLSRQADEIENADPAYRAELRAWTTHDLRRDDGVPAYAVPHVDGDSGDDLPMRDFDTSGMGWLPSRTESRVDQCLLLLGTEDDGPAAWLRAGQALERIWLELTDRGYAAGPLTQVIEVARTNEALGTELNLTMYPHVLMRVGRAPRTMATRRRTVGDVVIDPR